MPTINWRKICTHDLCVEDAICKKQLVQKRVGLSPNVSLEKFLLQRFVDLIVIVIVVMAVVIVGAVVVVDSTVIVWSTLFLFLPSLL
jgi:hypothetical protein